MNRLEITIHRQPGLHIRPDEVAIVLNGFEVPGAKLTSPNIGNLEWVTVQIPVTELSVTVQELGDE